MNILRNSITAILILFLSLVSANISASEKFDSEKGYVADELLIKYTDGTASAAAQSVNANLGAVVLKEFPEIGWQLIKLPDGMSVEQGLSSFQNFAGVERVQPNYLYKLTVTPNDPNYSSLYGMTKIDAPTAWNTTTGSPNVVVAVIDTGIRRTHEDIAANMWQNPGEIAGNGIDDDGNGYVDDINGWDIFSNDADPSDEYNHGTHVAATIGGVGNNDKGVAGVNWNVRLMALKIYDASGQTSTAAHIIGAYQYVRTMKLRGINIRVTNNSYGGAPEAAGYDQATKDAIDAVGDIDILNVFAAGNAGTNNETTPFYPSSYNSPSILAVAASDSSDNKASFSGYGATTVDLAAPGVGIFSATKNSDNSYGSMSGTSMATPHAGGAAALLAAAHPNLSAASLKATLMNSVNPLANWSGIVKSGGRLNIANAIANPTICNFNLSQTNFAFGVEGGAGTVSVTASTNCDFSAVSQNSWIVVSQGNSGSGNTTINFSVSSNNGQPRGGAIRVAGQNILIGQNGFNQPPSIRSVLDFDGDGKTDYSVVQGVSGQMVWHNLMSANGYAATSFGLSPADTAIPADFDGDNKADFAVFRSGAVGGQSYFYVLNSLSGTLQSIAWGTGGDVPQVAQDFDGDGKADFVVTRRINNNLNWFVLKSAGGFSAQQFGANSDQPVRGDFDGDGKSDLAVYRPSNSAPANTFFVLKSSDGGLLSVPFGSSQTDRIVSGDYDGDRKTDFAVWRSTTGVWYWLESGSANAFRAVQFGQNGDLPVGGDYDGDGKSDIAVWRPNTMSNQSAVFYVNRSTAGFAAAAWGNNSMQVPAASFAVNF